MDQEALFADSKITCKKTEYMLVGDLPKADSAWLKVPLPEPMTSNTSEARYTVNMERLSFGKFKRSRHSSGWKGLTV